MMNALMVNGATSNILEKTKIKHIMRCFSFNTQFYDNAGGVGR
jgi:hypothetical protein